MTHYCSKEQYGRGYIAGAFVAGRTPEFITLARAIADGIDVDDSNEVAAAMCVPARCICLYSLCVCAWQTYVGTARVYVWAIPHL